MAGVSPVCGNDNHGFWGITHQTSRTFVLATNKTKAALLEAMKNRRTYVSLDNNIQCRYTVNGAVMGSILQRPSDFQFDIAVSDPDTGNSKGRITKVDIVKDGGAVVQTYAPTPAFAVRWPPRFRMPRIDTFSCACGTPAVATPLERTRPSPSPGWHRSGRDDEV
jgi:hypothetical protein